MKKQVCKAVFPAAGLGTRFLPATKAQPKEMMPLVDKPIIQYGVEEALASGCDQIIIVTGRGKSAIEDHFDVSYELEKMLEERGKTDLLAIVRQISEMIHIAYVRQKEAMGLGHAVLMARELVGDRTIRRDPRRRHHRREGPVPEADGGRFTTKPDARCWRRRWSRARPSLYGVLNVKPVPGKWNGRLFVVQNLVEKPKPEDAPSNLAIIGRYILTPGVFEALGEIEPGAGGELQLTDGLNSCSRRKKSTDLHLRRQAPPIPATSWAS